MDEFCNSEFWNLTLIWKTETPHFTECFKKTILTWIPCLYLLVFLPLEIYYLRSSQNRNIPLNKYNALKMVAITVIIISTMSNMKIVFYFNLEPGAYIIGPAIKLFTYILFFILTYSNIKMGVRSSGILFVFSLLLVICEFPQFYDVTTDWLNKEKNKETHSYIQSHVLYYVSLAAILVLNCFADAEPMVFLTKKDEDKYPGGAKFSFLSRIYLIWFSKYIWSSQKTPITTNLWDVHPKCRSEYLIQEFEKMQMRITKKRNQKSNRMGGAPRYKIYNKESVLKPFLKLYWHIFLKITALKVISSILHICYPIAFSLLLIQLTNGEPIWKAYMFASIFFIGPFIEAIEWHFSSKYNGEIKIAITSILTSLAFKKALNISNDAKKEYTDGELNNLISIDIQQLAKAPFFINFIGALSIEIIATFIFIWDILGPSTIAGIVLIVLVILFCIFLGIRGYELQTAETIHEDKRGMFIKEMMTGLKVLKMYAWEESFEKEAMRLRAEELHVLRKFAYLSAFILFLFACFPLAVPLMIFTIYVLCDPTNTPDVEKSFAVISFINSLRLSVQMLPLLISVLIQGSVSIKRVNQFLNAEELDHKAVSHDNTDKAVIIRNGNFSWSSCNGPTVLKNINLSVDEGKLVAVVGRVGAGKSSLISAILGNMYKLSGYVHCKLSVAYVPQQAWILNTSLRENITFEEKRLNKEFYDKILDACSLTVDLDEMPDGDLTEIGENGINLSGGQKQRVSLARAIYQDKEIYLFDDPLSAVDPHVANHIFRNVLSKDGILKNKVMVLFINPKETSLYSGCYINQLDYIYLLTDGIISQSGTYEDLLSKESNFSEILNTYAQEAATTPTVPGEHVSDIREIKQISTVRTSEVDQFKATSDNWKTIRKLIEAEHVETKQVDKNVYMYYIAAFGLKLVMYVLLMLTASQILAVFTNLWLAEWSDSYAIEDNANSDNTHYYLFIYTILSIGQAITSILGNFTLSIGVLNATTILYETLLKNVLSWPMWLFDCTPTGRIINRFNSDIQGIYMFVGVRLGMLIQCAGRFISVIIVIIIFTPKCTVLVILALIVVYFTQKYFLTLYQQLQRVESTNRSPLFSSFAECASGISTIRAFNFQNKFLSQLHKKADICASSMYTSEIARWWLGTRVIFFTGFTIFFVTCFAIFERDTLGVALVAFLISYTMQIPVDAHEFVLNLMDTENNIISVERIKEYTEYPQEAKRHLPSDANHTVWPTNGKITFTNYNLKYRKDMELILKGISFEIKEHEKVGIIGRTGAGKSSLISGLLRIVEPHEGSIIIDGVNIVNLGLKLLRSRLTVIPQDPVLFLGTVRFNLDPLEQYDDEKIWSALEKVNLKNYVSDLPGKLQHKIEEAGSNFSFGQRQLMCLARALLRKTKILILDEATASIDLETDNLIQNIIRTEFVDCTVLTIAHRVHTVQDYDRILAMEAGQIVEFDSPANLRNITNSIFYKMAKESGLL